MSNKIKTRLFAIALVMFIYSLNIGVAYSEPLYDKTYIDTIDKIHNIEIQITKLQEEINTISENNILNSNVESRIDNISTKLAVLEEKLNYNKELLIQRIDNVEMPNNRTSRILNTFLLAVTIFVGIAGVASISGYIKQVVDKICENDIIERIKENIQKEVLDELSKEVYIKYSDSINQISDRLENLEQYEEALKVLQKMGDEVS